MKSLYLGNGDKQFKFADTTTEIHLNAFDDGSAADLTANAKVRIKNDAGYLLGVSANIKDNHAVITSGQLAQLPVGQYLIELWDAVDGGTAIYPSDGFLALQINENVTGLSGGLVSSITVDDFIKQFSDLSQQLKKEVSDAVANGLKGDKGDDGLSAYKIAVINGYKGSQAEWLASLTGAKGDTGTVDNAGLISAPAFQSLQTQVQNSAVGTNLLSNSRGKFQPNTSRINNNVVYYDSTVYMTQGQQYTVHADASSGLVWSGTHNPSAENNNVLLWLTNDTTLLTVISDANTGTGTTLTWNRPSGAYYLRVNTYNPDNSGYVENVKIEKGSVATDWCPNPSEILTQSDYAKIQAAIVALGGSIS